MPPVIFFGGFVREQVEEEANFLNIVNLMKKAGESGILFMDAKLGGTPVLIWNKKND